MWTPARRSSTPSAAPDQRAGLRGRAFRLVLVEALACGTPVVGRRSSAIPEVLDRAEAGVLFEGGSGELADALL